MESFDSLDRARARCRLYGLLALALSEPSADTWPMLRNPLRLKHGREAAAKLGDGLGAAFKDYQQDLGAAALSDLRTAHGELFGHTLRGSVPPYEEEYGEREIARMSSELADLCGFYEAFGMSVDPEAHERGDHITAELEFMAFLCAKQIEAASAARQDLEHLAIVRDAQRKFLRDHLACWGLAYARRLATTPATSAVYAAAGRLLEAFLRDECARLTVQPGATFLPLRKVPEAETMIAQMSCGAAAGPPGCADGEA
ncbi:MAG: molecular chaperone TorD family protein [Planctomycetota bacterium]|nr:molecular chaperone TorD family protein [Planctomycetota bacterium]